VQSQVRRDGLLVLQTFLFVVLVANTSDASISVSIQQALPISVSFPISIAFPEPLAPSVSISRTFIAAAGSADN